MPVSLELKKELAKFANKKQAANLQRFFKTGKGQYGEGDIFLGLKSKTIQDIAKKYTNLNLKQIQKMINSKIHEHRMAALRILTRKYNKAIETEKKKIFEFYLKNTKKINNWDLVDLSAPNIVGNYLLDKPRQILYQLARSKNLWEKRIAILSTFAFIRQKDFKDTLKISEILLLDKHDLIHKAVGWMLREVGKRNKKIETDFLNQHFKTMPRTMLRYAIEKFSPTERRFYLQK